MQVFTHNLLETNVHLSNTAKSALTISAIVIVLLGLIVYISIIIWAKKTRKKYQTKAMQEALIKIESMRNDVGVLPFHLKKVFKSKTNDYDIEGCINTVYQNHYQKVLCISEDLYTFAAISLKTENKIYYYLPEFDFHTYSQAQLDSDNKINKAISPFENQALDFVVCWSSKTNIQDLFEKFYPNLNPKGMIAIRMKDYPKKDLNSLINSLKLTNKKFDASYFGTKFLFIVKE
ncbi:BC85_0335 family putative methyltransferase [Mycoplasma buteonis]|uniref:BC85_0335 family putative methyltransferase n=1 Tax=Mycoplasma buteonis TaxID=171280 RepID=UPI00068F65F1|nr:hypothetical protein [Mycoplasma buteonis]